MLQKFHRIFLKYFFGIWISSYFYKHVIHNSFSTIFSILEILFNLRISYCFEITLKTVVKTSISYELDWIYLKIGWYELFSLDALEFVCAGRFFEGYHWWLSYCLWQNLIKAMLSYMHLHDVHGLRRQWADKEYFVSNGTIDY